MSRNTDPAPYTTDLIPLLTPSLGDDAAANDLAGLITGHMK